MLHLYCHKIISRFIAITSLVILSISSNAQFNRAEQNMTDHDSKPYYFGITIGGNMSRFLLSPHQHFLENDSVLVAEPTNSGGLSLGLSVTGRISNRFQARFNPQLIFMERNIYYKLKYPDADNNTELTKKVESVSMSFPIQLKFQSDRIGNFRVYVLGGFKADIDMASNARAKRAEELVKIEKKDYGPEFGIGFNFFFPSFIFSPEIKISNGIGNIHARDEKLKFSSVIDKVQSRSIMFSIHLEG